MISMVSPEAASALSQARISFPASRNRIEPRRSVPTARRRAVRLRYQESKEVRSVLLRRHVAAPPVGVEGQPGLVQKIEVEGHVQFIAFLAMTGGREKGILAVGFPDKDTFRRQARGRPCRRSPVRDLSHFLENIVKIGVVAIVDVFLEKIGDGVEGKRIRAQPFDASSTSDSNRLKSASQDSRASAAFVAVSTWKKSRTRSLGSQSLSFPRSTSFSSSSP